MLSKSLILFLFCWTKGLLKLLSSSKQTKLTSKTKLERKNTGLRLWGFLLFKKSSHHFYRVVFLFVLTILWFVVNFLNSFFCSLFLFLLGLYLLWFWQFKRNRAKQKQSHVTSWPSCSSSTTGFYLLVLMWTNCFWQIKAGDRRMTTTLHHTRCTSSRRLSQEKVQRRNRYNKLSVSFCLFSQKLPWTRYTKKRNSSVFFFSEQEFLWQIQQIVCFVLFVLAEIVWTRYSDFTLRNKTLLSFFFLSENSFEKLWPGRVWCTTRCNAFTSTI